MWETWLIDMMSGNLLKRVRPTAFPWSTSIAGDGEGTATIPLPDESGLSNAEIAAARTSRRADFRPNQRGLAVIWNGSVVGYAGKIESWDYSRDGRSIDVKTVELRTETDWRMTYGVNQYDQGTLSVSGRSFSGAFRAILARFMQWSSDWAYPIDLPADGTGTYSQTWEYWRKLKISDLLQQVEGEGAELYLRPYLTGNTIRWQALAGTRVTSGSSRFILNAPKSPLAGVRYMLSGVNEVTGVQGQGNGTGVDQPVAYAGTEATTGKPVRDVGVAFDGLTGDRLQAATNATAAANANPIPQISVSTFTPSDSWGPEHALPARAWSLEARRDPMIPDGIHAVRVVKTSGNIAQLSLSMEVQ